MAMITAKALKATETPEFTVDIGDGREVVVRRPDVALMVMQGLFSTPLLSEVVKLVGEWVGRGLTGLTEDMIKENGKILDFVDKFVCAAMVRPRVVPSGMPLPDEDSLHVDELTIVTKQRIVNEITRQMTTATREVVAAATDFPEVGHGAGTGPDVPTVSTAPIEHP